MKQRRHVTGETEQRASVTCPKWWNRICVLAFIVHALNRYTILLHAKIFLASDLILSIHSAILPNSAYLRDLILIF